MKLSETLERLRETALNPASLQEIGDKLRSSSAQSAQSLRNRLSQMLDKEPASREDAHSRLKAVMLQDRTTMTAQALVDLRRHLSLLIANFLPVKPEQVAMDVQHHGGGLRLSASVVVAAEAPAPTPAADDGANEAAPRQAALSLSRRQRRMLKEEAAIVVGNYLPIYPDSAQVEETQRDASVELTLTVKIADGVSFDERREMEQGFRRLKSS